MLKEHLTQERHVQRLKTLFRNVIVMSVEATVRLIDAYEQRNDIIVNIINS